MDMWLYLLLIPLGGRPRWSGWFFGWLTLRGRKSDQ